MYASQTRDDFSADDVEHYFNYMGMLATEVSLRMQCTSIELVIDSALCNMSSPLPLLP